MCNQVTNRVPYGLLSEAEQAEFSGEAKTRGMYKMFDSGEEWKGTAHGGGFCKWFAYRLIIKADEWYWADDGEIWAGAVLGESFRPEAIECYDTLRPASPAEIEAAQPKELTLVEKVEAKYPDYDVDLLTHNESNGFLSIKDCPDCDPHTIAQSMRGFYRYVYQDPDGDWDTSTLTTMIWDEGVTLLPIAVLFTKDSK